MNKKNTIAYLNDLVSLNAEEIKVLQYKLDSSIDEAEDYRMLYLDELGDNQYLRNRYKGIKKTVIKKFNENGILKAENKRLKRTHLMDKTLRFGSMYGMNRFKQHDEVLDSLRFIGLGAGVAQTKLNPIKADFASLERALSDGYCNAFTYPNITESNKDQFDSMNPEDLPEL